MLSIKDRGWLEFFLKDIFPTVQRGKRLTKANQLSGNKPYVSSTALNNGVDNYISNSAGVRIYADCITIANSGSVGASFYHSYEFVASDHVTHLKNDSLNKYGYLFISTQTSRLSEKYNFNREINDKRVSREKIILPVSHGSEPDWKFMEQYSKALLKKKQKEYIKYSKKALRQLKYIAIESLKDKDWDEFFIEDVVTIRPGKRLTKADMSSGIRPFIGSSDSNNGITAFVSDTNASEDSNVLGVNYNGSVVENFYHPYTAIFSDDVKRLSLKKSEGNRHIYLFLKNSILKQKNKYQYAYKFNGKRLKRQKIMLPIAVDGQPDYKYMEQYMKNLEYKKRKSYLEYSESKAAI